MLYHSRLACCKSPFGAVPTGEQVTFTVRPPREWGLVRVVLCADDEFGGRRLEVPLGWTGLEGTSDVYSCRLDTSGMLGPVWYFFRLEYPDGAVRFYGNNDGGTGGEGRFYDSEPKAYQLTVTHKEVSVPDWYGRGMTYHIFPDRFRRTRVPDPKGMVGDRTVHGDWYDCPDFLPDENGEIKNRDFFGGSLAGVREKLPYLQSLGVKTIYFSPIFEAASNHRYDTADYTKVDPMFGTTEEFEEFCAEAAERGMRVLLDGVFNHTGYDSVYFNGRGTYGDVGAFQSKESPYYDWYMFSNWPSEYSSWWGVYTLPQVNERDPGYQRFLYGGDDSVVRRWLRAGASGWRLDVADELPDECIEGLRAAALEEKPDAVIIGEVWEDASNKISYGVRRRYFLGKELDGVMNYPFRDKLIGYLLGGDASDFAETMENLRENYPKPCFYSLMNSLGTHDTPRILTVLGALPEDWRNDRRTRATLTLPPERRERAKRLLKMGVAVLFAFPGSPCVYYGDEAGLEGYEDPFNRRGYPWDREDRELIEWYSLLSGLRNGSEALQAGELRFLPCCAGELLAFERFSGGQRAVVALNRGEEAAVLPLEWRGDAIRDALSGEVYGVADGRVAVPVPPMSAVLLM